MIASEVVFRGELMKFKAKLIEERKRAGLTQEELAESSGVSLGALRNLEQGQRGPSWRTVVMLARALGVTADTFSNCDEVADKPKKPKK